MRGDLRWLRALCACIPEPVLAFSHNRVAGAAQSLLDAGAWCVLETCVDVPAQRWEPRLLVCRDDADAVADALVHEIGIDPGSDVRIAGYDRRTLRRAPALRAHLCYVAELAAVPPAGGTAEHHRPPAPRRTTMLVRDGMNRIVVTVGPAHTLREAARRMTARSVGAAVVLQADDQAGPGIITERDILRCNGVGLSIDDELVRDHLTSGLVYAAADWSLEDAAEAMVRGAFRHVIVVEGAEVVGILSMRDIVRCWTRSGATCDVPRA